MKKVCNTGVYWKCVTRKINSKFSKMDSNATNIVKDIFIIYSNRRHAQNITPILKKVRILIQIILGKVTEFLEIWMSY